MAYIAAITMVLVGGVAAWYSGWGTELVRDDGQTDTQSGVFVTAPTSYEKDLVVSPNTSADEPTALPTTRKTMLVAGGCFWCVEADLEKLPGVYEVVSGYSGGTTPNPTYENYAAGGHREVVEVTYDPTRISFEAILVYAMKHMDPTDDDGSFGDRGDYYSPAFFYRTQDERAIIENLIRDVDERGPYPKPLAIDVEAAGAFYPAEAYHQDYYKGAVSKLKYQYYRAASGRDRYIESVWGTDTGPTLPWRTIELTEATSTKEVTNVNKNAMWLQYVKPSREVLKAEMEPLAFRVTQEDGTERAHTSPLDKNYERGIYVDILSGEPLFSSRDKFDSGTGWPSFVRPITPEAVTEHVDRSFFSTRTEIRSRIADNHLGHVFPDGPVDRGGLRYCMNGVALRFIPEAEMVALGYGDYQDTL
jgi:peptide methionine sulfoxide reductase msrA/msrB